MYSWYLDTTAENWGGFITDDYSTIYPVSYTSRLGVKQLSQASFTREFEIIGDEFSFNDILPKIKTLFKNIQVRSSQNYNLSHTERVHQMLSLNQPYSCNYSKNAKRLIKKANKNYTFKVIECINELITLVEDNVAHKIKEFTPQNISKLKQLMKNASNNNKGETIAVFENEIIVAAGFFLKDKSSITYLKGASTDEAKKNGAMYGLMNYAFSIYDKNYITFDFGGSDIESVATFYKKFGAKNKIYYEYTINNLPLWFKLLKKLIKKSN